MLTNRSRKDIGLLFVLLLAWLTMTMNGSALAEPTTANITLANPAADDKIRAALQQGWDKRIKEHTLSDPEMAKLEQAMMKAQLNDDAAYSDLLGQYYELKAKRNPESAERLRKIAPLMVQGEVLSREFRHAVAHGKSDEAKKLQNELKELFKKLEP